MWWLLAVNMEWSGDVGIITGRYVSLENSTMLELWARAKTGESVLLRIEGLDPWFEVTPTGRWTDQREVSTDSLLDFDEIEKVTGPEMKLTELGLKPVWKIFVKQQNHKIVSFL